MTYHQTGIPTAGFGIAAAHEPVPASISIRCAAGYGQVRRAIPCGGWQSRRQGRRRHRANGTGSKEWRLETFLVAFPCHRFSRKLFAGRLAGKQKAFRLSCRLAEETKGKPLRGITPLCLRENSEARFTVQHGRCAASSAGFPALCLVLSGASLKVGSRLPLFVVALRRGESYQIKKESQEIFLDRLVSVFDTFQFSDQWSECPVPGSRQP